MKCSATVQVSFVWYFVENIFSKRCTFWSARECRHIFRQYIGLCEWTICAVKMVRESMTKRWLCSVAVATIPFLCDTTFCLNKLTTYEPPYMVTPDCLWSVGCQIVSSFDQCFYKVETRAYEKLRICTQQLWGLAVTTLPGASRSFNPALRRSISSTRNALPFSPH